MQLATPHTEYHMHNCGVSTMLTSTDPCWDALIVYGSLQLGHSDLIFFQYENVIPGEGFYQIDLTMNGHGVRSLDELYTLMCNNALSKFYSTSTETL